MKPMIRWYVAIEHGGAVGGPYKSPKIANEHLVTLSEKYKKFTLTVIERDIHKLKPHKRVFSNAVSN